MTNYKPTKILTGLKMRLPQLAIWSNIFWIAAKASGSPAHFIQLIRSVYRLKKELLSQKPLTKLVQADGKYFWNMHAPAWPSKAFDRYFQLTIQSLQEGKSFNPNKVRLVMLAITKKCPLSCEHCYEWNVINKPESLTLDQMQRIIDQYQNMGASQFLFGGGEPLMRLDDLLELIKTGHELSDCWITTSAYHLTEGKALALKSAGLRGLNISLDHFDADKHNAFRGHPKSFEYVVQGAANAHKAGLCLGFSICTTRSFISSENLMQFAQTTKELGAGFIQLLEPRAAGRYAGKDVMLLPEHYHILDDFYLKLNQDPTYKHFPTVINTSYNQRRFGCDGAGFFSLMIDTEGYVNACPFCRSKKIFALEELGETDPESIVNEGCYKFEKRADKIDELMEVGR